MSNFTHVIFGGLGIDFDLPSVAFSIGGYDIHFYGIIIAVGFALAVLYGGRMAYKWKMSLDGMTDVLIWGTIIGIICARLYYVAFEWDYYSVHLSEIPQIWNGGIAIYGGIIGALIGAAIGCKIGKIDFNNLLDLGAVGLLIGQGIGRWGNFFNQEAFGTNTNSALFRMWSPKIRDTLEASSDLLASKGVEVDPMMPVHPTFLYESAWCILGFFILSYILRKKRKFKGEVFALYGVWYGLERMIVEGLRTDSLYIASTSIRVSQVLSLIIVIVALIYFIVMRVKFNNGTLPKKLIVPAIIDNPVDDSDNAPTVFDDSDCMEQHLKSMESDLDKLLEGTAVDLNSNDTKDNESKGNDNDDNIFDEVDAAPNENDNKGWEEEFVESLEGGQPIESTAEYQEDNNGDN